MVVVIIIIGVVLLFLFFSDKKQEVNKIQQQGGFYRKYKVLIDYFLSIPEIKIERKDKDRIILIAKNYSASTRFTIAHGFEDVTIFWNHQSLAFGEHNLNWTFPEGLPQNQMLALIEKELSIYERNVLNLG